MLSPSEGHHLIINCRDQSFSLGFPVCLVDPFLIYCLQIVVYSLHLLVLQVKCLYHLQNVALGNSHTSISRHSDPTRPFDLAGQTLPLIKVLGELNELISSHTVDVQGM